ncbi:MAG: orotidine 5'-phosphate decarboxylase [Nitrospirae bacterium]|nr:orotidine 5'-phosphate decarboxylase [Nitrospirota bacterium]
MSLLQVALDFLHIKDALNIASLTYQYIDIIEAGTPLIKSEGVRVVETLKKNFQEKNIFADLKIMDTGALEAKMAFDAGADLISVCAQASVETITGAIEETRRQNKKIVIDLIGSRDWLYRSREIQYLKPDFFCIHISLDEQRKCKKTFSGLENYTKEIQIPFCIAGGIKPEDIPLIMPFQPFIIIVGGYIIKAEKPDEAAKTIKEAIINWKPQ